MCDNPYCSTKSVVQKRLITNSTLVSSELPSVLSRQQTPAWTIQEYWHHGMVSNWITTSSQAVRSTLPKSPFAARYIERLGWSKEHLKVLERLVFMSKYRISLPVQPVWLSDICTYCIVMLLASISRQRRLRVSVQGGPKSEPQMLYT